jgi:uncharacterized protein involved in response to NO
MPRVDLASLQRQGTRRIVHAGITIANPAAMRACTRARAGAGLARVVVPVLWPVFTLEALEASAALWSAGFGLYAVRYWPFLTRERLDGKPG